MDAENVADDNVNVEANQAVAIQVDDDIVPFAVEGDNNDLVDVQEVDDAIAPFAIEGFVADDYDEEMVGEVHEILLDDVADEAGDVIMEENENVADAVEAENAGEADEAGGAGGIGVGDISNWTQSFNNKSVLWDLEAPILGPNFEKFAIADQSDRDEKIRPEVNEFEEFMEYVTNVNIMSQLSNEEACARVRERLEVFQQRKIEYQGIKQKMHEESNDFRKCVAHLDSEWSSGRLDRALVIHLLRMRYIDTAYNLALKRGIQDLFDFNKFREADLIVKALQNKDLHPAKAWCDRESPWDKLVFEIFCQEYIEIVRTNQKMNAIEFARNNQETLMGFEKSVQRVLAVVAFGRDTPVRRYKELFDDTRWDYLIKLFWEQFIKTQWFTDDASSLCILLESGITALKVPYCFDGEDCKKVDPLQHEPFRTFASTLPHARHSFPPKLLCHVTKQQLGEHNPPYMLPNGYAYSEQAILGMINGDEVTCSRTGFVCHISELRILRLRGYTTAPSTINNSSGGT